MAQTTAVQKLNSVVRSRASRIFPILDWLGNYRRQYLAGDILAGIIVAILAIPEGMAYAMIAGMPPHVGLYASLLPLLIYPIFGSSRFVVVGPVAMISLLVANAIGQTTAATPSDYLAMAVTLAFLVGAINILLGVARLGILVNFFSHPVLSGFTSAAAIIIGMSQAKNFLGVTVPHPNDGCPHRFTNSGELD